MKNFLFAIFAFASLMAMGMAGPFGNGKTGLEVREDKDYSSHKQVIHGLMQEVMQQTGNINKTIDGVASSLSEDDKKELAKKIDDSVRHITLLLKQTRSAQGHNDKRDTLNSLNSLNSRDEFCDQECIYDTVYELVYEITCTVKYIISKLGADAVYDYLTPMVMTLIQLLVSLNLSIAGVIQVVQNIVNAIFAALEIPVVAIIVGQAGSGN